MAETTMEVATRKSNRGAPILSLVDREYLKSTANLKPAMWEPMSYLYSEADQGMQRLDAMEVPGCTGPDSCKGSSKTVHLAGCLEWVRQAAEKSWVQVLGWLDELLLQSQSIDALRSWQMMTGLQAAPNNQPRTSSAIMPDFPQPAPPGSVKPRRMFGRGG